MEFHKTLKPIVAFISKLQFSIQHQMKQSNVQELEIDVLTRNTCNGMYTEEFQKHLEKIKDGIISDAKEKLLALGTYYQKEILEIIIHVDRVNRSYFDKNNYTGIEETVSGMDLRNNEMYNLGAIEYGTIDSRNEPKEEFYLFIQNILDQLKVELSDLLFDVKQEVKPIEKLEWNVKPAVLAGLIQELMAKKWIYPTTNPNKVNWSQIAHDLDQIFKYNGKPTSFYNALKNEYCLSQENRREIELPPSKYFK